MDFFGLAPEGHPNPARVALHDDWPDGAWALRKDFPADTRRCPRVEGELPPLPPRHGRGRLPGPRGSRPRRHHRARALPVRRGRRTGAVPAAAALLRPQGHREAVRAPALAARASTWPSRSPATPRSGTRSPTRTPSSGSPGSTCRRGPAPCGWCCWNSSASTTTWPTSARWRPTWRSRCRRAARRRCAKAWSGCNDAAVRHAPAAGHGRARRRRRATCRRRGATTCCARTSGASRTEFDSLIALLIDAGTFTDRVDGDGRAHRPGGPRSRRSSAWPRARRAWTRTSGGTIRTTPTTSLRFDVPVEEGGDVRARLMVRAREVEQSLSILRQVLDALPGRRRSSPACPTELPARRVGARAGPRPGAARARTGSRPTSAGELTRVKITDPSFLNWPGLVQAVPGNIVPDFPVINKSFNLSYSGNDR